MTIFIVPFVPRVLITNPKHVEIRTYSCEFAFITSFKKYKSTPYKINCIAHPLIAH